MARIALKNDRQHQLETALVELQTRVEALEGAEKDPIRAPIFPARRKSGA
jgi:hypothetical protein